MDWLGRPFRAPRILSMRGTLFSIIAFALFVAVGPSAVCGKTDTHRGSPVAGSEPVTVSLFWTETCPHCAKARKFLDALSRSTAGVVVQAFELSNDERYERAFGALSKHFGIDPPAVPLIVIGDGVVVGYDEDSTTGAEIEAAIAACRSRACVDIAGAYVRGGRPLDATHGATDGTGSAARVRSPSRPATVTIPGIGQIETRSLSLPVLTLVLGAIDGFNPCAMWVLVFLIGLLVGMQDPFRMWSYGAIFLLTSAAVYFAFLAAWLNIFLIIGSLPWIRTGIGIFALGVGGYYLWQFVTNPEAACPVTSPGERQYTMTRLKAIVGERSFLLAAGGLVVLAVGVNMIELLCSAGIPAVYTQVLALSDLSTIEYYAYLTLYIAVFLLDDVIVFVTAMVSLRAAGLAASYARYSHMIGGVVLGAIGLLLLFKPAWLAFA
jgi:glutaredoxin